VVGSWVGAVEPPVAAAGVLTSTGEWYQVVCPKRKKIQRFAFAVLVCRRTKPLSLEAFARTTWLLEE
jgi:hypothetical protein